MSTTVRATTAIQVAGLTKRFGDTLAVDDVDFKIPVGAVTGFIGSNGSGKTTTLRMIAGLVQPDAGSALIDGRPYTELVEPRRCVGAALDRLGGHPGMSGRRHLRLVAASAGFDEALVGPALAEVGLRDAANRKLGKYSTGMSQRLALAAALLGDPPVLLLDEPARGLDPLGMRWLRDLLRTKADQGTAVFVSTHQLAELATIIDYAVIIDRGRIVSVGPAADLSTRTGESDLGEAVLTLTEQHQKEHPSA